MNERNNNNRRIKIDPDDVLFGPSPTPRARRQQANFTRNNTPEIRQPRPAEKKKKKKSFSIVKIFITTIGMS